MDFDFTALPPEDRYRLLVSFVVPRPIALVTSQTRDGNLNAAPMSFFNVFSQDPPIVILGIQTKPDGTKKDTLNNIEQTGEFVINMVDLALSQAMLICGEDYAPDIDEIATAGLSTVPTLQINGARITESPCAMECVVEQTIAYERRSIILGKVVQMHVHDDCLTENGRYVLPEVYQPIARLHANSYIASDNQFVLKPPSPPHLGIASATTRTENPTPVFAAPRSGGSKE